MQKRIEIMVFVNLKWRGDNETTNENEVAIVVDILRATTSITAALGRGAKYVMPAIEIDDAFELAERYRNALLMGERKNRRVDGFDLGNSPLEITEERVRGREVIFTSTNFPKALEASRKSPIIIIGSLLNVTAASETAYRLAEEKGYDICFMLAGEFPENHAREDLAFAGVAGMILGDRSEPGDKVKNAIDFVDKNSMENCVKNAKHGKELADSGFGDDIEFACKKDIFDIVPIVKENGFISSSQAAH